MIARRGLAHYNMLPGSVAEVNGDAIRAEFAKRLQAAMVKKGWNQSELARRATAFLPKPVRGQKRNTAVGRDSISHYVRGSMLPLPAYLDAISKALGLKPEDLMPAGAPSVRSTMPFEFRGMPDGRVFLRISRTVSQDAAMKIMAILAEEDRAP